MKRTLIQLISVILIAAFAWQNIVFAESDVLRPLAAGEGESRAAIGSMPGSEGRPPAAEEKEKLEAEILSALIRPSALSERRFSPKDLDAILKSYNSLSAAAKAGRLEALVFEWADIKDQPQYGPHKFTVGDHTLLVARRSRGCFDEFCPGIDSARRLRICLLHDIGKHGYEDFFGDHAKFSAEQARKIMRRLGYSRDAINADTGIILYHNALDWLIEQAAFPPFLDLEEFAGFLTVENTRILLAFKMADMEGKGKIDPKEFARRRAAYLKAAEKLIGIVKYNKRTDKRIAAIRKAFFKPGSVTVKRKHKIADGVITQEVSFKNFYNDRAASGRAIILEPGQAAITLWSHRGVMEYDYSKNALTSEKAAALTKKLRHKVEPKPRPGMVLAEIVEQRDDGTLLAACNGSQQNWGFSNGFFIVNGRLITKPKGVCGIMDRKWKPLDGDYTVFCFDKKRPGLRTVTIKGGRLINGKDIRMGIQGAPTIKNGEVVFPEPSRRGGKMLRQKHDEIFIDVSHPANNAAFSAAGVDDQGRIVLLHMYGSPGKEILAGELAYIMARKFRCREAAFMGGSADVQQWVRGDGAVPKVVAKERIGTADTGKVVEGVQVRKLGQAILIWQKGRRKTHLFMQPADRPISRKRIGREILSKI